MTENFYSILGVEKSASPDDIKKAYRNLARKFHPDVNKDQGAEAQFKRVKEAYETLSDDYKRRDYDNSLKTSNPFENFGGFNPFDFGFQSSTPMQPPRGSDLQQFIDLSFEEMLFGTRKRISYTKHATCSPCNGSGSKSGLTQKCQKCNGAGKVIAYKRFGPINIQETAVCDDCSGRGAKIDDPCLPCGASGLTRQTLTTDIEIPPGSVTGIALTVEGKGHDCAKNLGPPGDLVLSVSVRPHSTLSLEPNTLNIVSKVKLNVLHALIGTKFQVLAPDYTTNTLSNIAVTLPAGTDLSQKFRIPFRGLRNIQNHAQVGDLIILIDYEVPAITKLSEVEKVQSLLG